jgi:hypothetical protein
VKVDKSVQKTLEVRYNDISRISTEVGSTVFSVEVTNAVVDHGAVSISGEPLKAYIGTINPDINIDGLFNDWSEIKKYEDIDSEGQKIKNENVDISEYATTNSDSKLYFYLRVDGKILEGTNVPLQPYEYKLTPKYKELHSDSFNVGNNVEHELPDLPIQTGEDTIYVFLDTDNDHNTGYCPDWFPIGADTLLSTSGQNHKITSIEHFEYHGGSNQYSWDWIASEANLDFNAAIGLNEYESEISLVKMGLLNSLPGVYFHIVDWKDKGDYSDEPILTNEQQEKQYDPYLNGMRGVATYLVINEIYYASGVQANQRIEVANPTGSNAGNGFDIYDFSTSQIIATISSDISVGGFNTLTPNSAFSLGDILQLRDGSDNIVDNVTVPSIWAGGSTHSYSRYKDPADSNPYDTGDAEAFDPNDFYYDSTTTLGSANNLEIPEFHLIIIPVGLLFCVIPMVNSVIRRRRWK